MIILYFISSILSAAFYSMGGLGKPFQRWMRPAFISIIVGFLTTLWGGWNWTIILSCGLLYASLTTYFKPDSSNGKWYHWAMCGVAVSLAMIPYVIYSGNWMGFFYRLIITTLLTTLSSEFIGTDYLEEGSRGYVIVGSLPLLF